MLIGSRMEAGRKGESEDRTETGCESEGRQGGRFTGEGTVKR